MSDAKELLATVERRMALSDWHLRMDQESADALRVDWYGGWICLCPTRGCTAKEALMGFSNGWIQLETIRRVREMGADPNVTEEQALKKLAQLEEEASHAHGMWSQTL